MSEKLVSRPPGLRYPLDIGSVLVDSGVMNSGQYENFKNRVRAVALNVLPDVLVPLEELDQQQRDIFLDLLVDEFPELKQCQDLWPITSYFRMWTANKRHKSRQLERAAASSLLRSQSTPLRIKTVQYVGRRPPFKRRMTEEYSGETSSLEGNGNSLSCPAAVNTRPAKEEVPEPQQMPQDPIPSSQPTPHNQSQRYSATVKAYPEPCFACGAYPAPGAERVELDRFLKMNDMSDLSLSLQSFGIFHDGHLALLLSLSADDRKDMLMAVGLARPDFIALAQRLSDFAQANNTLVSKPTGDYYTRFKATYRCLQHPFKEPFSQKLFKCLKSMQIEILFPIATTLYAITSDTQFDRVRRFTEEELEAFMKVENTKVSVFHRRLLYLAFERARFDFF
ncbi:hypothetical protein VNI00_004957 [Paramarasmius palmivorus]|uniref:Uncharacterized protein n=1 Tax=Paramarasmius palmivorus TaxID=297713 RepID=A0AAW0DED5_9AGAR